MGDRLLSFVLRHQSLLLLPLCPTVLFVATIAILRGPNKEPYHCADGIEGPGPPRRINTDEDNQSNQTIKEEETSHSALIFDNGRKNTVPLPMRNGI